MQGFKFLKVKSAENEYKYSVFIIEENQLKKFQASKLVKSWSAAAQTQFAEKVKDFKLAEDFPYKTLSVFFDNGAVNYVLPLPSKIASFELQETLRTNFSGIIKATAKQNCLIDTSSLKKELDSQCISLLSSLAVLEDWVHPKLTKKKEEKSDNKPSEIHFWTKLTDKELKDCINIGSKIAEGTNLTRTLADTPSNYLKPDAYRELVRKRAKEQGYSFEFFDIKKLEKMGAGAFLSVTKGDPDDLGGIVHLTWKPKGKTTKKKLAIVGKGVCFDTGGYNIKPSAYMHGMHRDMTGSAVSVGLFELLVHLKVPYEVHCYLALAENLISPHASRPNDLIFASNGSSIELVDTDAEGRLVLADTLALASKEKPNLIIDFATLTGSAVRALDTRRAAVFSNNETWLKKAQEAGTLSGERTWGFPIGGDYWKKLKSDVADLKQCNNSSHNSDHIYAATFLSHFVEKGIDWIHMDLCTDTNPGGLGLVKTETTGFGVRWGYELLKKF